MSDSCFYIECLKSELERRKSLDAKYSLRLYAKDLGLDPSTLSSVMRGIRPFPWRRAKAVAQRLNIDETTFKKFIQSIHTEVSDLHLEHGSNHAKVLDLKQHSKMIEEWEYYAILTYFETKNAKTSSEYLAQKFDLPLARVLSILDELVRDGFLQKNNDGSLIRSTDPIKTPEDFPSQSLKLAHEKEMEIARRKMHELEPLMRDISSITFAGDPRKMAQAKKLIRSFRLKLCRLMDGDGAQDVYQLSMQLVPLTRADV